MILRALDTERNSASPPSDGAITPPTSGSDAEPAPKPEAASVPSSSSEAHPAKPPAASLVSIAVRGRPAGPAKAGDLTRFFELARRQANAPAAPSELPPAEPPPVPATEIESTAQTSGVSSPIETAIAEASPAPASLETAPIPAAEPGVSAEPEFVPEAPIEPSFPLMLASPVPVQIGDATAPAPAEPAPAPMEPAPVPAAAADVVVPDWVKAATEAEDAFSSEATEPLKVALIPMEETRPAIESPDAAHEQAQPAAEIAPVVVEPAPSPVEPPPALEPPPLAVAPAEPQAAPVPAAPPAPVFKELVDYWRSLRSGDEHPAAEAIDRDLVTERWPGTLLIAYTPASQDPRGELRPGRVTRLGTAGAETQSVVEAGSHSTEWMLEVARTALINDEPVEEQQRLETVKGVAGFRMVALPLGPRKGLANAVLCTLASSPVAPRFGKRRIWL